MTLIEKKSERKKKAIYYMVKQGEMSIAYALAEIERLNDEGKLLDADYEELAEYLESLLEPVEETEESTEEIKEQEETENTIEDTSESEE